VADYKQQVRHALGLHIPVRGQHVCVAGQPVFVQSGEPASIATGQHARQNDE